MFQSDRQESSLSRLKVSSEAKLAEDAKIELRKKSCLILILNHLANHGYLSSLDQLQKESNISLKQYTPADNLDLLSILQEYENYFYFKFGKNPKLTRKLKEVESNKSLRQKTPTTSASASHENSSTNINASASISSASTKSLKSFKSDPLIKTTGKSNASSSSHHAETKSQSESTHDLSDGLVGRNVIRLEPLAIKLPPSNTIVSHQDSHQTIANQEDQDMNTKLLKPIPGYGNAEFRELASIITRDIFMHNPNVKWDDIAGLSRSKRLMRESIVYPIKFPELFTGILSPWKGLLLYGPPGTGKTMLAKAVATECKTTFFNISASSIVSKWRGDSEKLVRVLFELARYHAPSTIFIDELESIMGQRGGTDGEHEGSRRMKTEILIQMDGLAKTSDHVFILAASNLPWELDIAMLRRLEKRIHIGLPDFHARVSMFKKNLPSCQLDEYGTPMIDILNYESLADKTIGYSGSDILLVCKEAAMQPLRKIFDMLDTQDLTEEDGLKSISHVREPVTQKDVFNAIETTRPSSDDSLNKRYIEWQKQYGSM